MSSLTISIKKINSVHLVETINNYKSEFEHKTINCSNNFYSTAITAIWWWHTYNHSIYIKSSLNNVNRFYHFKQTNIIRPILPYSH